MQFQSIDRYFQPFHHINRRGAQIPVGEVCLGKRPGGNLFFRRKNEFPQLRFSQEEIYSFGGKINFLSLDLDRGRSILSEEK